MYDFILTDGLVVDGTRKKPYMGSVYVKDGKIVKIAAGDIPAAAEDENIIDVKGHVIAPGFVNIHSHSDDTYIKTPTYESMLDSGVTFELCGQCGISTVPIRESAETDKPKSMAEYAAAIEKRGISLNVGMMIGHGAMREAVVGLDQRPLTPAETEEMCALLDRELKAGAIGVTFGLIYAPGSFCDTEEIKALARVCAANNKLLSVHLRNENRNIFEAVDEMIEVARETGVRLEISHLKVMGKTMWGRAGEVLARIDMARAKGISVHCDQYPYDASNSGLYSSLPTEAKDGGLELMAERMKDDAYWDKISENRTLPELEFRGGAENVYINEVGNDSWPEIVGKSLPEIAQMLNTDVADAMRQVLIRCKGNVQCIYHNMSMDDVLTIMAERDISVVSDAGAFDLSCYSGKPHPRSVGTFPRFFRLVRENRLMPIEDAVYKVSGLPSAVIGMDDRFGFIKEGMDADITVFDYDNITDRATYEKPDLKNEGIDYVFVNGQLVNDHGVITTARPGHCILK